MKVLNLEEISPTKRKLTLEIEPEDVKAEAEEAYSELSKEAQLPGFRKGKVPRKFLEYRFDKEVRKEAFGDTLQKAIEEAAKEKELKTVGTPAFDDEEVEAALEKAGEEAVQVSATLEIIPDFEVCPYQGLRLKAEDFVLSEDAVDRFIERQREAQAYYVAVDDRPTQKGDFLVVDLKARRGEEPFPPFSGERVIISNLGGGETPKEIEAGLFDRGKGERFEFEIDLEENNPFHEADGINRIQVSARIQLINERIVPDLDDEFAKDNGHGSLEDWRSKAREALEEVRGRALMRNKQLAILDHLLENTEMQIPAFLIQERYLELKYRRQWEAGESGEDEGLLAASEKSRLETDTMYQAEREARRELILAKIAEAEKIEVTDDEYYLKMAAKAHARGEKSVDRFLAQIDKDGLEPAFKRSMTREKVVEWLLEQNEFEIEKEA